MGGIENFLVLRIRAIQGDFGKLEFIDELLDFLVGQLVLPCIRCSKSETQLCVQFLCVSCSQKVWSEPYLVTGKTDSWRLPLCRAIQIFSASRQVGICSRQETRDKGAMEELNTITTRPTSTQLQNRKPGRCNRLINKFG